MTKRFKHDDNKNPKVPPREPSTEPNVEPKRPYLLAQKRDIERLGEKHLFTTFNNKGRIGQDGTDAEEGLFQVVYNPTDIESVENAATTFLNSDYAREKYALGPDMEWEIVSIIENPTNGHIVTVQQFKTLPHPETGKPTKLRGRHYTFSLAITHDKSKKELNPNAGNFAVVGKVHYVTNDFRRGRVRKLGQKPLSRVEALHKAKQKFGDLSALVLNGEGELVASSLQIDNDPQEWWQPAWEFELESEGPEPKQWLLTVDAYTGEVFHSENRLHYMQSVKKILEAKAIGKGHAGHSPAKSGAETGDAEDATGDVLPVTPDLTKPFKGQTLEVKFEGIHVKAAELKTGEFEFQYRNVADPQSKFTTITTDETGNFKFGDDPRIAAVTVAWEAMQQVKFFKLCGGSKRELTIVKIGDKSVIENAFFSKFPVRSIVLGVGKKRFRVWMCADGSVFLHEDGHDENDTDCPVGLNGWFGSCEEEGLADCHALLTILWLMSQGFGGKGVLTADYILNDPTSFYIGAAADTTGFLRNLKELVLASEETEDPHRLGICPGGFIMACLIALVKAFLVKNPNPTPEQLGQLVIEMESILIGALNLMPAKTTFEALLSGVLHEDRLRNNGANVVDFTADAAEREIKDTTISAAEVDRRLKSKTRRAAA